MLMVLVIICMMIHSFAIPYTPDPDPADPGRGPGEVLVDEVAIEADRLVGRFLGPGARGRGRGGRCGGRRFFRQAPSPAAQAGVQRAGMV